MIHHFLPSVHICLHCNLKTVTRLAVFHSQYVSLFVLVKFVFALALILPTSSGRIVLIITYYLRGTSRSKKGNIKRNTGYREFGSLKFGIHNPKQNKTNKYVCERKPASYLFSNHFDVLPSRVQNMYQTFLFFYPTKSYLSLKTNTSQWRIGDSLPPLCNLGTLSHLRHTGLISEVLLSNTYLLNFLVTKRVRPVIYFCLLWQQDA